MKPERFTAGMFVIVIAGMMSLCVMSVGFRLNEKVKDDDLRFKVDTVDWEELYPFADGRTHTEHSVMKSVMDYVKSRIEDYTSASIVGYNKIVEVERMYESLMCWNMVSASDYNAVVKLKDGYLTAYTMSLNVAPDAESVKEFADFCEGKGASFLYVNIPTKICASEDRDISGVLDFANQNADRFLAMLRESGVKYYDLREALHAAGMGHHASFFRTDHHWKPETGLWAAGKVLEILRDDLGFETEPEILRPENFRYEVYHDWFLGSQGKKVTLARTTPDDFTMIYPKFATRLRFEIPSIGLDVSGDFRVTYDMVAVSTKDYYGKNPYGAYIYADQPLIRIVNNDSANSKKILIIHESMSNCVVPFVVLGVRELWLTDLRHFTGSVRNFVETVRPDAVIVMYYATVPGRAADPSASPEAKKFYDFR
ncbi:MAG: hypothetical protein IJP86_01355 [Synergistaceae bacterium]|nr:hypothetical protein [Synergistaceae bacterium]